MMPIKVNAPPVQQSKLSFAPLRSPSATVERTLRPLPPPPSRISQLPTTIDRWGHMAGLGSDTDRLQTPAPSFNAEGLLAPVGCALLGFLAFSVFSK
jgi:hypothetical protein